MLVAFVGLMGQGKTLSMTAFGLAVSFFNEVELNANYSLSGTRFRRVKSFEDILKTKNGILLLDELWVSIDSRNFKSNVDFTRWLLQTRKKDLAVFYTTQTFQQVDLRLRQATHWIVSCQKRGRAITLTFINVASGMIGKKLIIRNPEAFYQYYDTYEVIEPFVGLNGH